MNCTHCGKENPSGAKFCAHCGEALIPPPVTQETATDVSARVPENENQAAPLKKKRPKWIFGVIAGVIVLFAVFQFARSYVEDKRIDALSSVELNTFSVTREQYDVIDPTYIMRYALQGDASDSFLKENGYNLNPYFSDDERSWYECRIVSDEIDDITITFDNAHQLLTLNYTYESQYTEQTLALLAQTLESITGMPLRWYHNGLFIDTSALTIGTEYICVLDCDPHFAKLELNEDGVLKVSYAFCEGKYFKTYNDYTENAIPANYEDIQKNQCDMQQVYFTGTVLSILPTDLLDIAMVQTDSGLYKVFYYQMDFVEDFRAGNTVKIYGDVLPDSVVTVYDTNMVGFDLPFESVQADVVEIIDGSEE